MSLFTKVKIDRFLFSLLVVATSCVIASAQGGVGSTRGLPDTSGGTNTVQGHLYFPEGEPGGKRLRVTIESPDEPSKSTQSDGDGSFLFNGLKPGSYTLVVDGGKEYDTARETIFFEGSHRNVVVPITLKVKGAAAAAFAGVPKDAVDLYKKAVDSNQKGDFKKAIDQLQVVLQKAPNFAMALSELGMSYMRLDQPDKAVESFEAQLKLTPNDATAHLNLGIALYNLSNKLIAEQKPEPATQKLTQAEEQLRLALAKNKNNPSAHYYLSLTLMRFKKYSEAEKEMEASIANGYDNLASAHRFLGGLYMNSKRNKDAADQLEKYLQLDPKARDAEQTRETIKKLRGNQ